MEDPLALLKKSVKEKTPVYLDGDDIVFDELRYPQSTEITIPDKQITLRLDSIWFYLTHYTSDTQSYISDAVNKGIEQLKFGAKKAVQDYLQLKQIQFKPDFIKPKRKKRGRSEAQLQKEERKTKRQRQEAPQKEEEKEKKDESTEESKTTAEPSLDSEEIQEKIESGKNKFSDFLQRLLSSDSDEMIDDSKIPDELMPFVDADIKSLKPLKDREIPFNSRTTISQAKVEREDYFLDVLRTFIEVKLEDRSREKRAESRKHKEKRTAAMSVSKPKTDSRSVWKSHLGTTEHEDLQIDTMGSNLDVDPTSAPSKPDNTAATSKENTANKSAASSKERKSRHSSRHRKSKRPYVIIIPAAPSSLITMYNVKDFLERGIYVPPAEAKKNQPKKPSEILVTHKSGDTSRTFKVVDTPSKLSKEDWRKVVGAFATGQLWQFKGWFSESPANIFTKMKGFHLYNIDGQPNETVKQWPVHMLRVSTDKEYINYQTVREFWTKLDEFINFRRRR